VYDLFSQKIIDVSDSSLVKIVQNPAHPDSINTVAFINHDDLLIPSIIKKNDIKYYESYYKNDTLFCIDYYSNNNKKKVSIYLVDTLNNGIIESISEGFWCREGQLIVRVQLNTFEPQTITNYYCNGNKKNQMLVSSRYRYGVSGKMISWYENGQIKFENYYDDKGYKTGKWKYWKEDGTLDRIEIYKDDELVETKASVSKKLIDEK
tara:strand:+ start:998 stop:1618 length:621 start_codon:yes stop_codon:yes gene_type:complete